MAAEVRKTGLLKKIEQRVVKSHEAHKGDETKYGMVDLPAGIKGGIARLAMAKLAEYDEDKKTGAKKGDIYAVFRGIAISPERHDGVQVKGQGVMVSIPLCDTKKTKDGVETIVSFDEHWAEFLNELRKFGLNTAAIPHSAVDATLLSLEKSKPVFRYSTRGWTPPPSPKEPNPKEMVFVQYDGVISDAEAEVATASSPASGFAAPSSNGDGGGDSGGDNRTATPSGDGVDELAALADRAESGDMGAIEEMKDKARALGITDEEIDATPSWAPLDPADDKSLLELMEAKARSEGDTGEPAASQPEAKWEPKVGGTCNYQIKKGGKVHQVRIEKLHKDGTFDALNIDDKKTKYLNAPVSKLSAA